jgi:hypothetical protein
MGAFLKRATKVAITNDPVGAIALSSDQSHHNEQGVAV